MTTSSNMSEEEATNSQTQPDENNSDNSPVTRVYKKSAHNITIYLGTRDIIISDQTPGKLHGVISVDPDNIEDKKVFCQITLTFRYGREDEEVMGLKFCNEAVMCVAQLYPPHERFSPQTLTPLQVSLMARLGPNAYPFTLEITHLSPPSVQLVPAKEYHGAPIGTSYDFRTYVACRVDEKQHRSNTIRMGIRVIQKACMPPRPLNSMSPYPPSMEHPPHAILTEQFFLSDGKVKLEALLDKAAYAHGDSIKVTITVLNNSKKLIKSLKLVVIQHVDVCMFSNGKFKNEVAVIDGKYDCPLHAGTSLHKTYVMKPIKGVTKNWIALEDSYTRSSSSLASTVICNAPEERNVFAIYVSYYVKVRLFIGLFHGSISVKLPFTLLPTPSDINDLPEHVPTERSGSPPQSVNIDSTQIQTEKMKAEIPSSTYDVITFNEYQGHPRHQPSDLHIDRSEL